MDDLISRQMAQRLFGKALTYKERIEKLTWTTSEVKQWLADCMEQLPSAQPDNQVHLCDSCSYTYPECPSVYTDMIFGNGTGNDNICACSKYLPPAQPEIIRCKDCKHWIPYDWMFSEVWRSKNIADYPEDEMGCDCCDVAMKANDFFSRGERRENG